MRSALKSIALTPERGTDPLEHVDYRLATTAEAATARAGPSVGTGRGVGTRRARRRTGARL